MVSVVYMYSCMYMYMYVNRLDAIVAFMRLGNDVTGTPPSHKCDEAISALKEQRNSKSKMSKSLKLSS